jgi:hypothetical protein
MQSMYYVGLDVHKFTKGLVWPSRSIPTQVLTALFNIEHTSAGAYVLIQYEKNTLLRDAVTTRLPVGRELASKGRRCVNQIET